MLVETLVLQRHESQSQMLRKLIDRLHAQSVGVGTYVLVDLIAHSVIDNGCLSNRHDISQPDGGGAGQNALEGTDSRGSTADT